MDFLSKFIAPTGVVAREVVFDGETGTLYFKRITAAQQLQLLKGQKIAQNANSGVTIDVDLTESAANKHRLVFFSLCTEDGSPAFKRLDDVQKLEASKVEKLYQIATEVNRLEDDAGKP